QLCRERSASTDVPPSAGSYLHNPVAESDSEHHILQDRLELQRPVRRGASCRQNILRQWYPFPERGLEASQGTNALVDVSSLSNCRSWSVKFMSPAGDPSTFHRSIRQRQSFNLPQPLTSRVDN